MMFCVISTHFLQKYRGKFYCMIHWWRLVAEKFDCSWLGFKITIITAMRSFIWRSYLCRYSIIFFVVEWILLSLSIISYLTIPYPTYLISHTPLQITRSRPFKNVYTVASWLLLTERIHVSMSIQCLQNNEKCKESEPGPFNTYRLMNTFHHCHRFPKEKMPLINVIAAS